MANPAYLELLTEQVRSWNAWRQDHPQLSCPDLQQADLSGRDLASADLSGADLRGANLSLVNLRGADLSAAKLSRARFTEADLSLANLTAADLHEAWFSLVNLSYADLCAANLSRAMIHGVQFNGTVLEHTNFQEASVGWAIFANTDLRNARGLQTIHHLGPSTVGTDTLSRSQGRIPQSFLRGAGLDDVFLSTASTLATHPGEYAACFISYTDADHDFAEHLQRDLQSQGIRCWLLSEERSRGEGFWHHLDEAIHLHEQLVVVLSHQSISSLWLANQITAALQNESWSQKPVLYPLILDEAVREVREPWAIELQQRYQLRDFRHWKKQDEYQKALSQLLGDLRQARFSSFSSDV